MMNIYILQYNYRSRYLVAINENTNVSVHKTEKYIFDQPSLSFQAKIVFIGESKICAMKEFFGALNNPNFDGHTILLEYEDNKYVYSSGLDIFEFRTDDISLDYKSFLEKNLIPCTFGIGKNKHVSYQLITNLWKTIKSRKVCY